MLLRDFYKKKKHAKFKDPSDWSAYKKLRNEPNSKIKFKRKSYFSQKLEESRGNINPISTGGGGGGVFSTSSPVNGSELQNGTSYHLETW